MSKCSAVCSHLFIFIERASALPRLITCHSWLLVEQSEQASGLSSHMLPNCALMCWGGVTGGVFYSVFPPQRAVIGYSPVGWGSGSFQWL